MYNYIYTYIYMYIYIYLQVMIPSSVSGPPRMGWVPPHPLHGLLPTNPKQCQVLI